MKEKLSWFWYEFIRFSAKVASNIIFRIKVTGSENIPADVPLLLLSNHQSFLDPVICSQVTKRQMCFMARDTLYKGWFGKLITSLKAIPVRRGEADVTAMKAIIAKLQENMVVCLFPEGTRTEDGTIKEVKPGFGLLSRRGRAGVVPMVIDGMHELWPKGKKFPRPGKVNVMIGKYYSPAEIKEIGEEGFAKLLTTELRAMQDQLREIAGRERIAY